jgi:glycosyltransferase involved in cell wall biosynthesis
MIKPEPTVTVIMATFNRAHLISESIDSVLNQTRPPDEFIIVNDGSTDDTAEVVERYGNRIRYFKKSNGGKPSALNFVLPHVESAYVWIFDDDDVALPRALELHLDFLSKHPECDFSYSTNYLFSGEFSEDALRRGKLKTFPPRSGTDYFLWIMQSPFLPTLMQGMLIPTRCIRAVGGFDEALLRCEDIDILLRLAQRFRAGCVEQPTFGERLHQGQRGPAFERHKDADRYEVFRHYKRRIFEKLRASLPLDEYLPKSNEERTEEGASAAPDMRRALLQRSVVMATHGLFAEAVEDFQAYVERLDFMFAPSDEERRQLSALGHVGDPGVLPPAMYYRLLGASSRGRPALFRATLRGLYWSVAREIRRHRPLLASRLLRLGASLTAGYAGMPLIRKESSVGLD